MNIHESIIEEVAAMRKRAREKLVTRRMWIGFRGIFSSYVLHAVTPALLVVAGMLRFVYVMHYVRTLAYDSKYRWYDGDGSADARLLLIQRDAPPEQPVEGMPYGASRMELPPDASERESYLALLSKVDTMATLLAGYTALLVPVVMALVLSIVEQLYTISGFHTILLSMRRAASDLALVLGLILLYTALSSFALHMIMGTRASMHSRLVDSIVGLYGLVLGDVEPVSRLTVRPRNVLLTASEEISVSLVSTFHPLLVYFILMQFVLAIITDTFAEERGRVRARMAYDATHETQYRAAAREAIMPAGDAMSSLRTRASALLYVLGMKKLAKCVLRAGSRRSHDDSAEPSLESDGAKAVVERVFEEAFDENSLSLEALEKVKNAVAEAFDESSLSTEASQKVKVLVAAPAPPTTENVHFMEIAEPTLSRVATDVISHDDVELSAMTSNLAVDEDLRGMSRTSSRSPRETFAVDNIERYLRMNREHRYELYLPGLGKFGVTYLSNIIDGMHEAHVAQLRKQSSGQGTSVPTGRNEKKLSPISSIRAFVDDTLKLMRVGSAAAQELGVPGSTALEGAGDGLGVTAEERLLNVFSTSADRKRLMSKNAANLRPRQRHAIYERTCLRLADRIMYDVGTPAGAELSSERGNALAEAVLSRALENTKGMHAVIDQILSTSAHLPVLVKSWCAAGVIRNRVVSKRTLKYRTGLIKKKSLMKKKMMRTTAFDRALSVLDPTPVIAPMQGIVNAVVGTVKATIGAAKHLACMGKAKLQVPTIKDLARRESFLARKNLHTLTHHAWADDEADASLNAKLEHRMRGRR